MLLWTGLLFEQPRLAAATTPPLGGNCVQAPAGIEHWWPADGNASDLQLTTNGFLHGAVTFVPGKVVQAFSFDGADGSVTGQALSNGVNDWAMTGWVSWRGPTGGKGEAIFYHGNSGADGYGLFVIGPAWCKDFPDLCQHQNELGILYGGVRWFTTGLVLDQNKWTHLALVRADNVLKIYRNGRLTWSRATVNPLPPSPLFSISMDRPLTFNGLIDEVALFNAPLNEALLEPIVAAGEAGMCKAPEFTSVFRARAGHVQFETKGPRNKDVLIYISPDLTNWEAVLRLPNPTGTLTFGAPVDQENERRFYRLSPAD